MIKVSVMYPNTPGARFDHEYYRDQHLPLVKARMGDSCIHGNGRRRNVESNHQKPDYAGFLT